MTTGGDLSEARRLLPEGSQVAALISIVPQPGVIGAFVELPHGMGGFVDVLILPRDASEWPAPGQVLSFEVLQHRPGQVRLWPLDPRFRHDEATPGAEAGWQRAKLSYPVGSVVSARVTEVLPSNREYMIRLADDDDGRWSCAVLPSTTSPDTSTLPKGPYHWWSTARTEACPPVDRLRPPPSAHAVIL